MKTVITKAVEIIIVFSLGTIILLNGSHDKERTKKLNDFIERTNAEFERIKQHNILKNELDSTQTNLIIKLYEKRKQ